MGTKELTYVHRNVPTRREQWAEQDLKRQRENATDNTATAVVAYAALAPYLYSGDSSSSYDSSSSSSSGSDSGGGSD